MAFTTTYPHIAIDSGGCARIGTTRYKVAHLAAEHHHYGWSAEELLRQHPDLRPEEVYAALTYFYDHHEAMLEQMERDERRFATLRAGQTLTREELLGFNGLAERIMKHLVICLAMMLVTSFSCAQAKEQRGADLDALIKQLESEDARERAAACYELGKLHEKAEPAAMKVATLLAKDEDVNVRKMAAQTLGEIAVHAQGDPGENPKVLMGVLIDALGHPKAGVRLMAAESIGNFRKNADPATLALARLATSDGDPRVRHAAIQSLGNIGHFGGPQSEKALPYLQKALSDPDPEIRRLTVYVLSRFGEASRPMIPKLIDTLRDGPPRAQKEAARTLAGHGPAAIAAVPVLFDKLHQRRHLSLRSAAAEAIVRIDPSQWDKVATILIEATRSEDSGIRMFALDALLKTARKREHFTKYVVPTLERLRTDDIVEIQLRAAEELETIEPQ